MYDIGSLVEQSVATGRFLHGRSHNSQMRRWTDSEKAALRKKANTHSIGQIAEEIGRSPTAVKVKLQRFRIHRRVKRPDEISLHDAAELMGKCGKSIIEMHERGLFPARVLPHDGILARAVSLPRLYRWAVKPDNWIYFDPHSIRDEKLRRLVLLAQSRWPDEWLTTGQVEARVNERVGHDLVHHKDVNRAIMKHGLPAVRWNNWMVKRSDADAFDWQSVKTVGKPKLDYHHQATNEWLVLASAVGLPRPFISQTLGWRGDTEGKRTGYLLSVLRREGTLPGIAAAVGVAERDGLVFADWRDHAGRLPGLVRAVARWHEGRETAVDRHVLVRVVSTWAAWHAQTDEQRRFVESVKMQSRITHPVLQRHLDTLAGWGVYPLGVDHAA